MRKSKVIRLDAGREVTLKEVSPKMLMDLFDSKKGSADGKAESADTLLGFDKTTIDNLCRDGCGLSIDELAALYGSELEQVWEGFKEVNSFFFKTAARLGLGEIPARIGASMTGIFGEVFANSLKADTPAPASTAGPGSARPSSGRLK